MKPRTNEWETYCDECYYHMWRVRRKNERGFNDGFHVQNGEAARQLVELLNKQDEALSTVTEQRDSIDSMYHKVIKEVLECDPIPACKREDAQLESPWEVIARVREQRDRLADLVKQFIYILDITEESDGGRLFHPTNITSCRAGDLQKIGELVEALRRASRNQPTEL